MIVPHLQIFFFELIFLKVLLFALKSLFLSHEMITFKYDS